MTAIDTTLRANGFAFAPRFTRAAETLVIAASAYFKRRATRIALESLTDRALDDIGLTRFDVANRF